LLVRQDRNSIEALRDSGRKEAARLLFEAIRALFKWAKKQRSYKLKRLPTDEIDPNAILGRKSRRKCILSNEELRALWHAAKQLGYPDGTYVQLLFLTALRHREAAWATWDEFMLAGKEDDAWIIPARRMKAASPQVVPIAQDIAALLSGIPRFCGTHVFSFNGGHSPINNFTTLREKLGRMMLHELRRLAKARGEDPAKVMRKPFYLTDIRRTVRTRWSAIGIPQGHIVRGLMLALRRTELQEIYNQYAYFKERKIVLQEWARRLKNIVEPESPHFSDTIFHSLEKA